MTDATDAPYEAAIADADPADPADGVGAASRSNRIAPFAALGVAIVMLAFLVLLVGADPDDGLDDAETPLLGRPAPEATATDLRDGSFFDLSRRKGSWVVLNFFQSECRPCILEHPELIEFVDQQRALPADGAEFYSIAVGDTREAALGFFEERGGDWPVLFSDNDRFPIAFGVAAVPETWIIDPNGIVSARFISEVDAEGLSVTLQQLRERQR
ncbi:MAG: TlpA disulfide reductase family protein [Actinomycetota bacterium]